MENMTQMYVCPHCGKTGTIEQVVPVLSDVRYDSIRCQECGSVWRVYYKVTDMNTEVMYIPQADTATPVAEKTAEVAAEAETVEEA